MIVHKLPDGLTSLERRVLLYFLEEEQEGDEEDGLASQLTYAEVSDIDYTGVGFFRQFTLSPDVPSAHILPDGGCQIYFQVYIEHPELEAGALIMLFVREGVVSHLEGITNSGNWPQDEDAFFFHSSQP